MGNGCGCGRGCGTGVGAGAVTVHVRGGGGEEGGIVYRNSTLFEGHCPEVLRPTLIHQLFTKSENLVHVKQIYKTEQKWFV